jgi:hypothetical protein
MERNSVGAHADNIRQSKTGRGQPSRAVKLPLKSGLHPASRAGSISSMLGKSTAIGGPLQGRKWGEFRGGNLSRIEGKRIVATGKDT